MVRPAKFDGSAENSLGISETGIACIVLVTDSVVLNLGSLVVANKSEIGAGVVELAIPIELACGARELNRIGAKVVAVFALSEMVVVDDGGDCVVVSKLVVTVSDVAADAASPRATGARLRLAE